MSDGRKKYTFNHVEGDCHADGRKNYRFEGPGMPGFSNRISAGDHHAAENIARLLAAAYHAGWCDRGAKIRKALSED